MAVVAISWIVLAVSVLVNVYQFAYRRGRFSGAREVRRELDPNDVANMRAGLELAEAAQ